MISLLCKLQVQTPEYITFMVIDDLLFVLAETRPVGPVSQPVGQAVGLVLLSAPLDLRGERRPPCHSNSRVYGRTSRNYDQKSGFVKRIKFNHKNYKIQHVLHKPDCNFAIAI